MFLNPLVIINVLDAQKICLGTVTLVRLKTHRIIVFPYFILMKLTTYKSDYIFLTTKHAIFVNKSSCAVTFPQVLIRLKLNDH